MGVPIGDILTNNAVISSETAELRYDNNTAQASSVVGDVANDYTIIDIPAYYEINQPLPATITYGNNGNIIASGSVLTILLDTGVIYNNYTLLSGPISSCTYNA